MATAAAFCILVAGNARIARADGDFGDALLLGMGVVLLEPLIPDLRYEIGNGTEAGLVLSWPISFARKEWYFALPDRHGDEAVLRGYYAALQPVVEPQWRPSSGANRVVGLARTVFGRSSSSHGFAVAIDAGGVVGEDGHGGVVGTGLLYVLDQEGLVYVGLFGRAVITNEGTRFDVSLDLHLF